MPTSEELKAGQRADWDAVAGAWEKWDAFQEAHTRPISEWLCRAASLSPGARVLDLASGSGQPAFTAAELVRAGGWVVATDIAPEMVNVLRRRIVAGGINNMDAQVMDMESMSLPDASFDAVTCRWGFMFPPDPVKALAESRRVLRPGGRLALAVWDLPAKNAWLSAFVAAINEVSPPAAPPDPKALGPFRLCDRDQLEGFLRSAGFSGPSLESVPFSFEFDSGEGWWEFVFEIAAPVRNRILALDAGAQAKVRQLVLAQAEAYRSGGKIKLPAANLCAWAEK